MRPIPRDPPVTSATLPSREKSEARSGSAIGKADSSSAGAAYHDAVPRRAIVAGGVFLAALSLADTAAGQDRVPPIGPGDDAWTEDVRAGIETWGVDPDEATTLLRGLARHPPSLHGLGPLARYLRQRATVPVVDGLLIGLRVAWLCQSEALWAELAAEARTYGLGDADLRRVAEGSEAGWGNWDGAMLRVADQTYQYAMLQDDVWAVLADRYNTQQMIDVIFTAAEYILLSMLANSLGVEPDARFTDRFPGDVRRTMGPAGSPPMPLAAPRFTPLARDEWSDEVRELLDPQGEGGPVLNLYATLARHPVFFRPRAVQSAYIRLGATLSPRAREILILRIGWLCGSEYEWAQHVRVARRIGMSDDEIRRIAEGAEALGWDPLDAALIRATDELHGDATISDATWRELSGTYGIPELIDVVITVAGYRMVSIALNSLGTQLEPDRPRFPDVRR